MKCVESVSSFRSEICLPPEFHNHIVIAIIIVLSIFLSLTFSENSCKDLNYVLT